jgi:hypothetical protein
MAKWFVGCGEQRRIVSILGFELGSFRGRCSYLNRMPTGRDCRVLASLRENRTGRPLLLRRIERGGAGASSRRLLLEGVCDC